jgi:hypothetical protein
MVLRITVNRVTLKSYIERFIAGNTNTKTVTNQTIERVMIGDVLPCGIATQFVGALGWAGLGNCDCLGRRQWEQLGTLRGFWVQALRWLPLGG